MFNKIKFIYCTFIDCLQHNAWFAYKCNAIEPTGDPEKLFFEDCLQGLNVKANSISLY